MGRRQRRRLRDAHGPRAPRPRRRIDHSPWGEAAQAERLAAPAAPASLEQLERLGVDAELRARARRWRRCKWAIDAGVPRLVALGLIETTWLTLTVFEPDDHGDWRIRLLLDRPTGRAVMAGVCTPSAREQLDWLWDTLCEYAAGAGPGDDYYRRLGAEGVLDDGLWYSGWLAAL